MRLAGIEPGAPLGLTSRTVSNGPGVWGSWGEKVGLWFLVGGGETVR